MIDPVWYNELGEIEGRLMIQDQPTKIKVELQPKPNCEVIVDIRNQQWEARWYDKTTDWVYTYHQGYLWPQRQSKNYYRFRLVEEMPCGLQKAMFKKYLDYQTLGGEE